MSITLDPTSIDFSTVAVGSTSTMTLNIKAAGFGPFNIISVTNGDAQFSSGISTGVLSTGDNNFPVNFSPSSTGSKSDTFAIMIFDNADASTTEYDLPVSGEGTAAPPVAAAGFVSVVSQ